MGANFHVVIDVRMHRHAGIGTYIRNLVPRVIDARPAWRFTLLAPRGAALDWMGGRHAAVTSCASPIYSIREQLELPASISRDADLLWSPHYNVPLVARTAGVVTVHDVSHLALGGEYASGLRRLYARTLLGAVRRRAHAIMFDSEFSKQEFARFVGEPSNATVVHCGVDAAWSGPVGGESPHARPYLLFVGSIKPHKNLAGLLVAFRTLLGSIEHDLVIVGNRSRQRTLDRGALEAAAAIGTRVQFAEDPDDATLKRYVAHAAALVMPSLYEGFGLPALEAMAAGCPCIVSNAASLPEVCGDAALYCDPRDPTDIAAQITRLLQSPELRARLVQAGRARVPLFTWDLTASRTLAVLDRALADHVRRVT